MGMVTDIQRFSIHDGPGIRTTVFLKGCNLRCVWCHNPETLDPAPELQTHPERCIACGACVIACRHGAHTLEGGRHAYDRTLCVRCGECARTCYAEGLALVGREMSAEEVVAEALEDRVFYEASGGGVTLSGGEPLYQPDFARSILAGCRAAGLHTAIETNLAWPWSRVESVLPLLDLVMFDLKCMDSARHAEWTGAPNGRILENAARLAQAPVPLVVRTPVIGGFNDCEEEIAAIARFIAPFPRLVRYELLPYHALGSGKWESLGKEYRGASLARPSAERMRELAAVARACGIACTTSDDREEAKVQD
jgi:pyruvate formate lyase activating enzyme